MLSALAAFVVASALAALGQVSDNSHPTTGFPIGIASSDGFEIVLPSSADQCEPFLIYYNNTGTVGWLEMRIFTPDDSSTVLASITFPTNGTGYVDWFCNIPFGYSFVASVDTTLGLFQPQYYTVGPGTSSTCLGDLSSYPFYNVQTSAFQSYTQRPPSSNSALSMAFQYNPTAYPTDSVSTITINSLFAATTGSPSPSPTTISSAIASPKFTPPAPAPVSGSSKSVTGIKIGVAGGVLLILILIFIFLRWRRKSRSKSGTTPFSIDSPPIDHPGMIASPLDSASIPTPFMLFSRDHINGHEPTPKVVSATTVAPSGMKSPPSAPIVPIVHPVPPRPKHTNLTLHLPPLSQSSTTSTRDTPSDLASALDIVSRARLTTSQRRHLAASLNNSGETPPNVQLSAPLSTSESQDNLPDLAAVLDVISRAQLSVRERNVLSSSLGLLGPTGADADTISSPPPYPGP